MSEIKGIFAASMSILDKNLTLNSNKTILHAESLIDQGLFGSKSGRGFYKSDENWTDSVKTRIAKGLASFK